MADTFFQIWPLILLGDLARYVIGAGLVFLAVSVWWGRALMARRIQLRCPMPADVKREITYSLLTVVIFSLVGYGMLLGIRGVNPRRRDFVAHLEALVTATGEPLPSHTRQALTREHERLCVSERQIKEIEAARAAAIQRTLDKTACPTEKGRGAGGICQTALLLRLKGLGQVGASVLSQEVFYRHFDNRREVASYFGLTPSPYSSGSMRTDQGIGKAGNPRARTLAIELAWLWVRHQPKAL